MPAKSQSQQKLMGMVYAYKKGKLDTKDMDKELLAKIRKMSKSMKLKDVKDFAETKHQGIPQKVENVQEIFTKDDDDYQEDDLETGTEIEEEHDKTYRRIKNFTEVTGELPDEELIFTSIAKDHLDETPFYYDEEQGLPEMEDRLKELEDDKDNNDETGRKYDEEEEEELIVQQESKILRFEAFHEKRK
jgi:hypothetical protein